MSEIRPFEEQSFLERTLRAHLWHPTDALKRAETDLTKAARRKEYRLAAAQQTIIIKSKPEIEKWNNLLELYEDEFHGTTERDQDG